MNVYLDLGTDQVIGILLGMMALIFLIIVVARVRVANAASKDLTAKYHHKHWSSPLQARAKYPDVEVLQYRPLAWLVGAACALALTTALMNWTVIDEPDLGPTYVELAETDIEITPPQTAEPPPPPPPPPPPAVIEVPDELVEEMDETVEFMDQSIEAETVIDIPAPPTPEAPVVIPPPPPPPPRDDAEEIFKLVEEMPRFPGCEDMTGSSSDKKLCADQELYKFINGHLKYPSTARENNIGGTVVVQFVVNKDGTIQDISIIRDIGAGCGEEVVRVVSLMNEKGLRWAPGKQRGSPVRVMFMLPVRFTLLGN